MQPTGYPTRQPPTTHPVSFYTPGGSYTAQAEVPPAMKGYMPSPQGSPYQRAANWQQVNAGGRQQQQQPDIRKSPTTGRQPQYKPSPQSRPNKKSNKQKQTEWSDMTQNWVEQASASWERNKDKVKYLSDAVRGALGSESRRNAEEQMNHPLGPQAAQVGPDYGKFFRRGVETLVGLHMAENANVPPPNAEQQREAIRRDEPIFLQYLPKTLQRLIRCCRCAGRCCYRSGCAGCCCGPFVSNVACGWC